MNPKMKKAVALTTARTNKSHGESYFNHNTLSRADGDRLQKIAEYKRQIPKAYRAVYEKAVSGKSLRAAVNAQCLECTGWQRKEITFCSATICPLWMVRPYQEILQDAAGEGFSGVESTNGKQGVLGNG